MRKRGVATGEAANYRQKAKDDFDGYCDRCGDPLEWSDAEVHHADRDRGNDNRDNMENLCHACHSAEHHGEDPLWGLVVSLPRPVIEMLDGAVERRGYHSRSEAVARALVDAYDSDGGYFGDPTESVVCWYSDDAHTRWVSDSVVEPPKGGDNGDG